MFDYSFFKYKLLADIYLLFVFGYLYFLDLFFGFIFWYLLIFVYFFTFFYLFPHFSPSPQIPSQLYLISSRQLISCIQPLNILCVGFKFLQLRVNWRLSSYISPIAYELTTANSCVRDCIHSCYDAQISIFSLILDSKLTLEYELIICCKAW